MILSNLVFQTLHRSRDPAASLDHHRGGLAVDLHDRTGSQQASEIQDFTGFVTDSRNHADRRSLRAPANPRSRLCISQTSIGTKLCIS